MLCPTYRVQMRRREGAQRPAPSSAYNAGSGSYRVHPPCGQAAQASRARDQRMRSTHARRVGRSSGQRPGPLTVPTVHPIVGLEHYACLPNAAGSAAWAERSDAHVRCNPELGGRRAPHSSSWRGVSAQPIADAANDEVRDFLGFASFLWTQIWNTLWKVCKHTPRMNSLPNANEILSTRTCVRV